MGKTRNSANLVSSNNIFVDIENDKVGIGTTLPTYDLDVSGSINLSGSLYQNGSEFITPYANSSGISTYSTSSGISTYSILSGISTYSTLSGISTLSEGLTGIPNISVGIVTASNLIVSGITTSNETRFLSVAEKVLIVDGNNVSIAYTSTGTNVGLCTNSSGDISLSVTDIPTDSSFDNHAISFSIFVSQTGTARSCTSVSLNGVNIEIKWAGGSFAEAVSGVSTSNGYDIYSFVGINTVGSASTTLNYDVLGVVNGGFR